jgi:hypothetical protein
MAENEQEGILEDAKEGEEQTDVEISKKGISTSLLIKIAIGLAVLLIILAVSLFFFTGGENTEDAEGTEVTPSEEAQSANDMAEQVQSTDAEQTSIVELPMTPDQIVQSENGDMTGTPSADGSDAAMSTSEKALAQILTLQEQIARLEAEKQELAKQVETLEQENLDLKKEVEIFSRSKAENEIPLDQLVNNRDLPRDYRRDDYANTPKFDLEPKWGEADVNQKQ